VDERLWKGAYEQGWRVYIKGKRNDGHYWYVTPKGRRLGSKTEALSLGVQRKQQTSRPVDSYSCARTTRRAATLHNRQLAHLPICPPTHRCVCLAGGRRMPTGAEPTRTTTTSRPKAWPYAPAEAAGSTRLCEVICVSRVAPAHSPAVTAVWTVTANKVGGMSGVGQHG